MARFFGALILALVAVGAFADTPTPQPSASAQPAQPATSARIEEIRKSIEQLPPEQQEKVLKNLHRWQALSPEERDYLRQQERVRNQKQEESAAEAYQKSGLHLTEAQRIQFRKRYVEERRKLEEELAKESQERRTAGNTTIVEQLKKEFSTPKPSPTPSVALH
ncbi:MAG TPA: DUF3106 domain-containing protein [Chthoniobacterales bacterium]|jgi:hypothetical protein